jgi:polysaccharide export outer membrane protein
VRVDFTLAKSKIATVFAVAAAAFLASCADTRGGPVPYDVALAAPDAPTIVPLEDGYKIAPLDKLTIKVLKMDDMTGEYVVDLGGNISMPLIGEVRAANLTTAQLDQALTAKLGEKYLEHPDVSVGIKESQSHVVTVDGAVQKAGSYPSIGPISLMQAVAMAGGTTDEANVRRVAVFRTVSGQRQVGGFDLAAIRHGQSPDPKIYPGDIVVVDGSGIKSGFKRWVQAIPILSIFRPF